MSWDLFIQDIPPNARNLDEIPDDFRPGIVGNRSELIEKIKTFAPDATFADPSWGSFEGPGFSIEFSMGVSEDVDCIALHVHGGADDSLVAFVSGLLECLAVRAFDPSSESGIFEARESSIGFQRWTAYRDRIKDSKT
ncbi:MAG TPA: hypothetical protein VEZ90_16735 [Blastocatellia bacterium]|nr:hypothetical protein [Blastocatellia bacterium]